MSGIYRCLLLFSLLAPTTAISAREVETEELFSLDLASLMEIPVVTASRHPQKLWQAPAIVTVIEGEDMRRRGYRSIAEALARVPGFYVVDDGVGQYVVLRGVGSGQRSYARPLKVMIDGQPLGLRSNANQFLGPELLPLSLVERIEVVRGPASALYGADAYLGVINIITRQTPPGAQLQLSGGQEQHANPSYTGEVLLSNRHENWHSLAAATYGRLDADGRTLPKSSPNYNNYPDDSARNDIDRPLSLFTRAGYRDQHQDHSLTLHASERDSHGEFLDFGTLSHDNRVVVRQQTLSWQSHWQAQDNQQYSVRVAHAWGGNSSDEKLSLGQNSTYPAREFGYRSWELAAEGQYNFTRQHVVIGADGSWDTEQPFDTFIVDSNTDTRTQISSPDKSRLFRNLGLYFQYQLRLSDQYDWELALNWRRDSHNRYDEHDSYRVGLTGSLLPNVQAKLLYGTSFKAPNAFQLYANPLFTGDMIGNQELQPETAKTLEGQLLWSIRQDLLLTLTAYKLEVQKQIELLPFGLNSRWGNRGTENGYGAETELRWQQGAHQFGLTTSWQDTMVEQNAPLLPELDVQTASAPRLLAAIDWRYRWTSAETGLEARYVSRRRASDSNIDVNLREAYTLPDYTLWRFHASKRWATHRIGCAVDNLFNEAYADPGYGGIDLPGTPRTVWLSWTWEPQ